MVERTSIRDKICEDNYLSYVNIYKYLRCKKVFPDEGDNFEKFEFIYCSVKCLNQHKALNYS